MATQETATYLALVTLSTEDGELPTSLEEVADLIQFQLGSAYLTEPPPYGTGLQSLGVGVTSVDRGEGFTLATTDEGELVIMTGVYQESDS